MVHAPKSFFPLLNGREFAIVYSFVFLYFWIAGGGEWSLESTKCVLVCTGIVNLTGPEQSG